MPVGLSELDWANSFIESYRDRLAPELTDNAYAYSKARWHYASKNYSAALKTLQTVVFSDPFYALGTKATILKVSQRRCGGC